MTRCQRSSERVIRKCLEKEVERRYQSARELFVDLRNLKRDTGAPATPGAVEEVCRHNLPEQLTSFVGRDHELAEIERLLASTRLLTLTGAGGCGKTRLALQVAAASLPRFKDGAWLVDLAPLCDANLVTQTVATVLGVREGSTRSLRDSVTEHLRHRHILLVLDNCEHFIDACAKLAEAMVRGAPRLRLLATSREGLGISGETVWRVPSLSLPDCPVRSHPSHCSNSKPRGCSSSGPSPSSRPLRSAGTTSPRSPKSATGWMASPWRSNWPRPG